MTLSANTYWNGTPVSVFDGYQSSYQHQDLLGTKRLLTFQRGQSHLRIERSCVIPARSPVHLLSSPRPS